MITLHVKLQNEYFKLNDYIEQGNITWGKNGDDGVSVTLKNVPNGKNLLADALGQELVAYRAGELCWQGFVNSVTENENGIEIVGRGDFHRLEYIEDFNELFSASTFEDWKEISPENSKGYPTLTTVSGLQIWIDADYQSVLLGGTDSVSTSYRPSMVEALNSKVGNRTYMCEGGGFAGLKSYGVNYSKVEIATASLQYAFANSYVSTANENTIVLVLSDINYTSGTIFDMGTTTDGFKIDTTSVITTYTTGAYYYDGTSFIYISPRYDSGGNVVAGGWPYNYSGPIYDQFGNELVASSELYNANQEPLSNFAQYDYFIRITFKSSGQTATSTVKLATDVTIVRISFNRSGNSVSIKVDDNAIETFTKTVGTAPTVSSCIGGTAGPPFLAVGNAFFYLCEFLFYSRSLTDAEANDVYNYLYKKYKGDSHQIAPEDAYNLILMPRFSTITKITTDFENRAYMTIPNGSTFVMGDSAAVTFKVPNTVTADILFNFIDIEYRIPSQFELSIFAYDQNNNIARFGSFYSYNIDSTIVYNYTAPYPAAADGTSEQINYDPNKVLKQLVVMLTFVGCNEMGQTPLYSFTNNQSDNYYYVNVKNFRSQIDPFIGKVKGTINDAPTYQIVNYDGIPITVNINKTTLIKDFRIFTPQSTPVNEGNLIYIINTDVNVKRTFLKVKRIEKSTYNGNPVSILYTDIPSDFLETATTFTYTLFNIVKLPTSEVVKWVINKYLPNHTQVIIDAGDDLSSLKFDKTKASDAIQQLADNIDFKFYVTANNVFFIEDATQEYYLMQDSKNVSQSFDKVYTDVRTKYSSIYQASAVTEYFRPSEKYNITKSKTVEQGTLSRSLATIVSEKVAREDSASAVKVIPQSGDLYNNYGAVVRDPKINSSIVLKNVIPELISLGDKTYYLSEIRYDFTTGEYEYVIDEPGLTFESILSKVQNI